MMKKRTDGIVSLSAVRIVGVLALAALLMLVVPSRASHTGPLAYLESVRPLASAYPCAVLALLHILNDPKARADEVIYVDQIPSAEEMLQAVDELSHGDSRALAGALQRNLYSGNTTFLRIRWRTASTGSGSDALVFDAELVNHDGTPLLPRHVLETVTLAVSAEAVRVVPADEKRTPSGAPSGFAIL
jgi:hypothetical protein